MTPKKTTPVYYRIENIRDQLAAMKTRLGTYRAVADELGVSLTNIWFVMNGVREPGVSLERAMGLRKISLWVKEK